jgi:hypothetical protein
MRAKSLQMHAIPDPDLRQHFIHILTILSAYLSYNFTINPSQPIVQNLVPVLVLNMYKFYVLRSVCHTGDID